MSAPSTPVLSQLLKNENAKLQYRAVVIGATGAVGRQVVSQILESEKWVTLITYSRKSLVLSADEEKHADKLTQVVIDFETILNFGNKISAASNESTTVEDKEKPWATEEELALLASWTNVDAVFCALGTTRKAAGSAEAFRRVDLEYVVAIAQIAKRAGVKHFSLVSAQGANANLWASDLSIFHGLLYTKTKGMAENGVIETGIPRVSIYQPGLLNREKGDRAAEGWAVAILPSIHVRVVAKAMLAVAECTRKKEKEKKEEEQWVSFYGNSDMFALNEW